MYVVNLEGKRKGKEWLALLPIDYYGEEAFLYKKNANGYEVTGNAYIVNKAELKEKQKMVYQDYKYSHVQAIYV